MFSVVLRLWSYSLFRLRAALVSVGRKSWAIRDVQTGQSWPTSYGCWGELDLRVINSSATVLVETSAARLQPWPPLLIGYRFVYYVRGKRLFVANFGEEHAQRLRNAFCEMCLADAGVWNLSAGSLLETLSAAEY